MDLGKRIHELRFRNTITAQELADRIGVSQSYISLLENNKRRANVEVLAKMAQVFEVSLAQFFSETLEPSEAEAPQGGPMRAATDLDSVHRGAAPQSLTEPQGGGTPVWIRLIPIVSKVATADPAGFSDGTYPAGFAEEFVPAPAGIDDPNAFALRVSGDSMSPRFRDGDIVICSPSRATENGDAIVAKVNGDEAACRIFYRDGDNVVLSPVNPRYPAQVYPFKEIRWIYPVLICQRREKR